MTCCAMSTSCADVALKYGKRKLGDGSGFSFTTPVGTFVELSQGCAILSIEVVPDLVVTECLLTARTEVLDSVPKLVSEDLCVLVHVGVVGVAHDEQARPH